MSNKTKKIIDNSSLESDNNKPQNFLRIVTNKLFHSFSFYLGGGIVLLVSLFASFPKLVTKADPNYCVITNSKKSPNADHLFGTDVQGCDYLAKVIYGGRNSIAVGFLVTIGILIIGILLGTLAGFYGKLWDMFFSRITDIFFAIPTILGAMVILTVISDRNVFTISLALGLFGWMAAMRLIRSSVISVKEVDFVQAAKASGVPTIKILLNHIIPNSVSPVIVYATTAIGSFIASEAALTFLGLGFQAPETSWGLQISEAQHYFRVYPYLLIFPSIFLSVTVLGFMLLGDAVRKALDVRAS